MNFGDSSGTAVAIKQKSWLVMLVRRYCYWLLFALSASLSVVVVGVVVVVILVVFVLSVGFGFGVVGSSCTFF